MNLYEINQKLEEAILNSIDTETGEIISNDELEALELARDEKIENIACFIKNLEADVEAFKNEKNAFAEREKAAKSKVEWLKGYLSEFLDGEKFETTKAKVTFRKSTVLEIADRAEIPESFLKYEVKFDKAGLKKAVKDGLELDGVQLVEKNNISIK